MYSQADIHIHTTYSDGLMTPKETVEMIATQTDLRVLAITDHDTTEGAVVAQAYALRHTPLSRWATLGTMRGVAQKIFELPWEQK